MERSELKSQLGSLAESAADIERFNAFDNRVLFAFGQFRIDRQMEDFSRGGFGVGQATEAVSEVRKAFLHVEWNRVVNLATDALFGQVLFQRIPAAVGYPHAVLIPDVRGALVVVWQL